MFARNIYVPFRTTRTARVYSDILTTFRKPMMLFCYKAEKLNLFCKVLFRYLSLVYSQHLGSAVPTPHSPAFERLQPQGRRRLFEGKLPRLAH
jgi:hypothetical protein